MLRGKFLPTVLLSLFLGVPGWTQGPDKESARPTYVVPKGWQPQEAGPLSLARFQVGDNERVVEVSITGIGGDGGGLPANVNRWRNQIGLEPLGEAEALKAVRPLQVAGLSGHLVDLTGPDMPGKPARRILVAVVKQGQMMWWFKMIGGADSVKEQKAAFEGLMKSVRFEK
jgi:hypothetical protein